MKESANNKAVFFEWVADSRYYEKKPDSYFRAIIVLAVLVSLLLFFLKEHLLIFLVWVICFVVYVRAVVPPPPTKYTLSKFGLQFFNYYLYYQNIAVFSVIKKPKKNLLRIFTKMPEASEFNLVLPEDSVTANHIIEFLKDKTPYVETIPKNEIEKLADWLGRITGFS